MLAVVGMGGNVARGQQTVFLDFDSLKDQNTHEFTPAERTAILARFQADYAQFDFVFTTTAPALGQEFSSVWFGIDFMTPGLLGIAEQIDFRNLDKTDNCRVTVDTAIRDFGVPDATENWINLASNTGAHELGHILGLRHAESFGPIGSGVHFPPGADAVGDGEPVIIPKGPRGNPLESKVPAAKEFFADPRNWCGTCAKEARNAGIPDLLRRDRIGFKNNPIAAYFPLYPGPIDANETTLHIMGSGASVGTPIEDKASTDLFFSERSAVKLAFSEDGEVVNEENSSHGTISSAQELGDLPELSVPDTLEEGEFAGETLEFRAVAVIGKLSGPGQRDFYSFEGEAGDLVNLEVLSNILFGNTPVRVLNPIDPQVTVYHSDGRIVDYYGDAATNDDEFETFDSSIIDLILPEDDTYSIEVRETANFGFGLDTGDYELYVYILRGVFDPLAGDDPDFPPDCTALGGPAPPSLEIEASIGSGGDFDTFCFEAEQGVDYVIRADPLSFSPLSLLMSVIDINGVDVLEQNSVETFDCFFGGFIFFGGVRSESARIEFTPEKTGSYYVQLHACTTSQRGRYQLSISTVEDEPEPPPLVTTGKFATVKANPLRGMAPLVVNLQGGTSALVDLAFSEWDFGDGSGDIGNSLTHVYTLPGLYTATYTAQDVNGVQSRATVVIEVLAEPNELPMASISASSTAGQSPLTIQFDGFGIDSDGQIIRYDWNFGDGDTGAGQTIEHTFTSNGTFNVVLTVTDDAGDTGTDFVQVIVGETQGAEPPGGQPVPGPVPICGSTNALTYSLTLLGIGGVGLLRRRWL